MRELPFGAVRVDPFDDAKVRVAKLRVGRARLLRARPRPAGCAAMVRELDGMAEAEMAAAAADPAYAPSLLSWVVSVSAGWAGDPGEAAALMAGPVDSPDFLATAARLGGGLYRQVPARMAAWGHPPGPPAFSADGFEYAAVCTGPGADRLCVLLHVEFSHECRRREARVARAFAGFEFPDLRTDDDARAYLKRHARRNP